MALNYKLISPSEDSFEIITEGVRVQDEFGEFQLPNIVFITELRNYTPEIERAGFNLEIGPWLRLGLIEAARANSYYLYEYDNQELLGPLNIPVYLVDSVPSVGGDLHNLAGNIILTFSENVVRTTEPGPQIIIWDDTTNTVVEVFEYDSTLVTIVDNVVTINPSVVLADQEQYEIVIDQGYFTNADGSVPFNGINRGSFVFTTDSFLSISNYSPPDAGMSADLDVDIILTFTENVLRTTTAGPTMELYDNTADATVETFAYNSTLVTIVDNVVTINPTDDFIDDHIYTLIVDDGYFVDTTGTVNFVGLEPDDYTFKGCMPVEITTFSPLHGSLSVDLESNIVLTFNQNIVKTTTSGPLITLRNVTTGLNVETFGYNSGLVSISGNVVTINPSNDYVDTNIYTLIIDAGYFKDATCSQTYGGLAALAYQFVADAAIVVDEFAPSNGGYSNSLDGNIILTYSEDVFRTTALSPTIELYDNTAGATVETFAYNSTLVTIVDNIVTIDPTDDFTDGHEYTLIISPGYVTDEDNRKDCCGVAAGEYTFTAHVAITIDTFDPVYYKALDDSDSNIVLTFSEDVIKATTSGPTLVLYNNSLNTVVETFEYNSTRITTSGDTVTINPTNDLPYATQYSLIIDEGYFTNLAGNVDFLGLPLGDYLFFSHAPITLDAYVPENLGHTNTLSDNIVLTFSQDELFFSTSAGPTIELYDNTADASVEIFEYDSTLVTISGDTVTIDPTDDMIDGHIYTLIIDEGYITGQVGIQTFKGLDADDYTFAAKPAITITNYSPPNTGSTAALTDNIVLTFSEDVIRTTDPTNSMQLYDTTTLSFDQQFLYNSTAVSIVGNVVTINPTADFQAGHVYSLLIGEGYFTDTLGERECPFLTTNDYTFTANDAIVIDTYSPENGGATVALSSNIILTFNKDILKTTVSGPTIELYDNTADATVETFAYDSGLVTIVDDTVTINPTSNLTEDHIYTLIVDDGYFTDSSGLQDYPGFLADAYTFTAKVPITLDTYLPTNGATVTDLTDNIVLTFSENVLQTTTSGPTIVLYDNTNDSVVETFEYDSSAVTIVDNVVTINPTADLDDETDFTLIIDDGYFTDSGDVQTYRGLAADAYTFITRVPITITTYSPLDGGVTGTLTPDIKLTFSEDVVLTSSTIVKCYVYRYSPTTAWIQQFYANSPYLSIVDNVLTIDLQVALEADAEYMLIFENLLLTSVSGIKAFPGLGNYDYTFTATDTISITHYSPIHTGYTSTLDEHIMLTFSQDIIFGTTAGLTMTLYDNTDTANFEVFPLNSVDVSIMDNQVTIDPTTDLVDEHEYTLIIDDGYFTDTHGTFGFEGLESDDYTFTANETITLDDRDPSNGGVTSSLTPKIKLTFSEDVLKTTIGGYNIYLKVESTLTTVETFAYDSTNVTIVDNVATIQVTATLTAGTTYCLSVDSGYFTSSTGLKTFAGIADYGYIFTAADAIAINTFLPANAGSSFDLTDNIVLTFSEDVIKATSSGPTIVLYNNTTGSTEETFAYDSTAVTIVGNVVTINPSSDWLDKNEYTLIIDEGYFTNTAGTVNYLGLDADDYKFTANEIITITDYLPVNGGLTDDLDDNIIITYSEDILKSTSAGNSITLFNITTTTAIEIFPYNSPLVTIVNNVVTINPTNDLVHENEYTLIITKGYFTCTGGLQVCPSLAQNDYIFTADAAITIDTYAPPNAGYSNALDENIVLTFSENVLKATSSGPIIEIWNNTVGASFETFAYDSSRVTIAGNVVTIDPNYTFLEGNEYTVIINSGYFTDDDGVRAFPGTSSGDYTFTSHAEITVNTYIPANGGSTAELASNIILAFSEDILITTTSGPKITLYNNTLGAEVELFEYNSTRVVINSDTVTINPTSDLLDDNEYTLSIDSGYFTDVTGNVDFLGIDQDDYTFTANAAITVTDYSPGDWESTADLTSNIVLTFSEDVLKTTTSGPTIVLYDKTTSSSVETYQYNSGLVTIANNVVTINPTSDFTDGHIYTLVVAADYFTDVSAIQTFPGLETDDYVFYAHEEITLDTYSPINGASTDDLDDNIVLTFSENVLQTTTSGPTIQLYDNTAGALFELFNYNSTSVTIVDNVVTINPGSNLTDDHTYTVIIGDGYFTDVDGQQIFTGLVAGQYTFVANVPITLDTYSPPNGGSTEDVTDNIVLTFSEDVLQTTTSGPTIVLYNNTTGSAEETFAYDSTAVTIVGGVVTINPTSNMLDNNDYTVIIDDGYFTDTTPAQTYRGLGSGTYTFTANIPITITGYTPANGGFTVGLTDSIVITFSEDVTRATSTSYMYLKNNTTSVTVETFWFGSSLVSVTDNVMTINPTADFQEGVTYTLLIDDGYITDLAGKQQFHGLTFGTYTFTAENPITVTAYNPVDDGETITITDNIELTFSENLSRTTTGTTLTCKLYDVTNSVDYMTWNYTSTWLWITDNVVTFNPAPQLVLGNVYSLIIDPDYFLNAAGTKSFGGLTLNEYQFTAASQIYITTFSPTNGGDSGATDLSIVLTFSENVIIDTTSTERIILYDQTNNGLVETHAQDSTQISITDNVVTIDLWVLLTAGYVYSLEIPADFFTDTAGEDTYSGLARGAYVFTATTS